MKSRNWAHTVELKTSVEKVAILPHSEIKVLRKMVNGIPFTTDPDGGQPI